jgi:hypothetical protein
MWYAGVAQDKTDKISIIYAHSQFAMMIKWPMAWRCTSRGITGRDGYFNSTDNRTAGSRDYYTQRIETRKFNGYER